MKTIRILDLNIWNYNDPWPTRRDLIADLILDTEPDIVALQEIRYRDWSLDPRHQADQILVGLPGYRCIWHPAHHWPPGKGGNVGDVEWEGLAILSPHPIVDQALLRLSRAPDDPRDNFQRLVQGAQVRTPAGPFWLFNTHYPLSAAARERVAVESLDFVRTARGEPFAFVGDLNARPGDPPIRHLTGQTGEHKPHGHLIDAWEISHPGEPGYTHPAWGPHQRIDYVLVPSTVAVREMQIVGMVPDRETVSPSDHCGLLATLQIGGTGAD
jgi:endonuclease/exonuclease/phosphatase family metal-dependent hydrolase